MISFRGSFSTFNENWWANSRNEMAQILLQDNQSAWPQEIDPQERTGWAPLSAKYASWKSRIAAGQPILRLTGRMQDRTRIRAAGSPGIFTATMGADYGRYHMFGTSKMPARPWLGVPQMSMPRITEAAARAINRGRILRF